MNPLQPLLFLCGLTEVKIPKGKENLAPLGSRIHTRGQG